MRTKQQQIRQLLSTHVRSSRELTQGLDVSQPTLSRLIAAMSHEIIVMGKGRSTCYGLPRKIHNLEGPLPAYTIDPRGDAHQRGNLTALQGGQYWWEETDGNGEIFNQIPWFLQDLKINGYGARSFSYRQKELHHLPRKATDWSDEDILFASSCRGEDRTGNLIIGEESLARYFSLARNAPETISIEKCPWVYPQMAQKTLAGVISPTQVSGEQPKFSACVDDQGSPCHMLVKFSPATDSNEARRYADLLICEHLALEAIRMAGHSAARSRIIISGKQVFLCLKRFDRRGAFGRLPLLSLRALHTQINAPCDNWINAASRLKKHRLISRNDADKLYWLSLFSDLTGNTNQHFGNISLIPHQHDTYIISPAYGLRPTLYEPIAGEIPERLFSPPPLRNEVSSHLESALKAAIFFWKSAAVDTRISATFRQICYENCERLRAHNQGPQLILQNPQDK